MVNEISIMAPLDTVCELEQFKELGVNEIYCGYVPKYWLEAFNRVIGVDENFFQIGINKRDVISANITSIDELKKIVCKASSLDIEVFVTLNAAYYPSMAYPLLEKYLNELLEVGVRNVIVNDFGLIRYIAKRFPDLKISVSCLSQVTNIYTIKLLKNYNVRRIVFPRHISINEVIPMLEMFPELEFEIFVLSGKCIYDDGFCRCNHDIGSICCDVWKGEFYNNNATNTDDKNLKCSDEDNMNFWRWTHNFPVNQGINRHFRNVGCSLCSLAILKKYPNLKSLKIVGRSRDYKMKAFLIELTRDVVNLIDNNLTVEDIRALVGRNFPYNTDICKNNRYCIMRG